MASMKSVTAQARKEEGARFLHYFGPLLDALRGLGGSGTPDEVIERIAADLKIPDELQNETLPSGEQRFRNQVAWARFYLVREGLLDSSKRGVWSLTERGRSTKVSLEQARDIRRRWVRVFDADRRKRSDEQDGSAATVTDESEVSPDLQGQVIDLLRRLPAEGFERLSQRLLREAGFIQVVVTGRSGDGGIDGYGTLQVNPLVSFKVLFQCKRYTGTVSPSQVRDFRGAMSGRTDKGIIITTGTFTAEARREASREGVPPIELIDGEKLVEMFKELEFGLRPVTTYDIDKVFFDEFKK
jgi:restriction system protein